MVEEFLLPVGGQKTVAQSGVVMASFLHGFSIGMSIPARRREGIQGCDKPPVARETTCI